MRQIRVLQPDPMDLLARLGRQLTEAQSAGALHRLLIDTAIRLVSPRRALLLLQAPAGPQIACARLPRGEVAADLLV